MEKKQECGCQRHVWSLEGRKHPGSPRGGEKKSAWKCRRWWQGCSVIPVEQTLSRGQAAFPAPVCYFSLGPEGREMPGPLLIQETEEGKCEWLLSGGDLPGGNATGGVSAIPGTASDTQPGPSLVRSPPLAAVLGLLQPGSRCQMSGGESMQDWQ